MLRRELMKRKPKMRPVAYQDGTIAIENMPLPAVHYPGHYGMFISFGEAPDKPSYICSCARKAIEWCINAQIVNAAAAGEERHFIPPSFPSSLAKTIKQVGLSPDAIEEIPFRDSICHVCQHTRPSYRWCHEMYGRQFVQDYGWYIQQCRCEYGVFEHIVDYKGCPEDIRILAEIDPSSYFERQMRLWELDPAEAALFAERFHLQQLQVSRAIENIVRSRLRMKPMNYPSAGESKLYGIVRQMFPNEPVYRCCRPRLLKGMELDIYLPSQSLAFEYQGEQHYQQIKHWGGEVALARLVERDQKKQDLCKANGILLVSISYNDEIDEALVRGKIALVQSSLSPKTN